MKARTKQAMQVVDGVLERALLQAMNDRAWGVVKVLAEELEARGPLWAAIADDPAVVPHAPEKTLAKPPKASPPKRDKIVTMNDVLNAMSSRGLSSWSTRELAKVAYGNCESATMNKLAAHLTGMRRKGLIVNPKHGFWRVLSNGEKTTTEAKT